MMKLEQGQVWKQGADFLRIVDWSRMEIVYKTMKDLSTRVGTQHRVTKKEFCRMLKDATLLTPEQVTELSGDYGKEVEKDEDEE